MEDKRKTLDCMNKLLATSMQEALDTQTCLVGDKEKTLDHMKKLLVVSHVGAFNGERGSVECSMSTFPYGRPQGQWSFKCGTGFFTLSLGKCAKSQVRMI